MAAFLRITAILVGLANLIFFTAMGDFPPVRVGDVAWLQVFALVLVAVVAGLLISELLLGPMRRFLEGAFFWRYAAIAFGVCLGGAVSGALLPLSALIDLSPPLAERAGIALAGAVYIGIGGTLVGLVEGLVLAFPLAALLDLFRDRS